MKQKDFSYSRSRILKTSGDVKFIKNPPEWAILWSAQKGMLTEGSYSVKVAVNDNALFFLVEEEGEEPNLIIDKNGTDYSCKSGGQNIVLSPRERVVNGVAEKWHTRIR